MRSTIAALLCLLAQSAPAQNTEEMWPGVNGIFSDSDLSTNIGEETKPGAGARTFKWSDGNSWPSTWYLQLGNENTTAGSTKCDYTSGNFSGSKKDYPLSTTNITYYTMSFSKDGTDPSNIGYLGVAKSDAGNSAGLHWYCTDDRCKSSDLPAPEASKGWVSFVENTKPPKSVNAYYAKDSHTSGNCPMVVLQD